MEKNDLCNISKDETEKSESILQVLKERFQSKSIYVSSFVLVVLSWLLLSFKVFSQLVAL